MSGSLQCIVRGVRIRQLYRDVGIENLQVVRNKRSHTQSPEQDADVDKVRP